MKKRNIFLSIFAFALCLTMLTGFIAPNKKPILAKEMCKAEEIIEYTFEEIEEDDTIGKQDETKENENSNNEENTCYTCVCVIGNAKLTLTPDTAKITACIEKFNENINLAKNENLEILNAVMKSLKEAGIKEDKITLDYFSAHPSYDFSASHQPVGFYSKSCFSFDVENLDEISTYISVLTENGVTDICDVCYSVSNIDEEYNNALSKALENAKSKAEKLFGTENFHLCGIKEESVYSASTLSRNHIENLSSSLMGKVEIEARVNVLFKEV